MLLFWWELREKCSNTEFFLVRVFLYWDWIQENKDQKRSYLDTYYAEGISFTHKYNLLERGYGWQVQQPRKGQIKGWSRPPKEKKKKMVEKMASITKGKPCVSSTPGQLLERGLLSLWSVSFPEPLKTVILQKQI